LRNEQTKHVHLPDVYQEHENAKKNVATWMSAQFLKDGSDKIVPVSTKLVAKEIMSIDFPGPWQTLDGQVQGAKHIFSLLCIR
jgi:hypothetical protein